MNKLEQNEQKNPRIWRECYCARGGNCCTGVSVIPAGVVPHADQQWSPWSSWCWSDVAVHRQQIRRLRGVHAASEIPFSARNPLLCCCSAVVSIYIPQSHFSGVKCVSVILCPALIFWKNMKKTKWPLKPTPENTEWPVTSQNSIWHRLPSYSSFTKFMVMLSHSEQHVWYFVRWTSCKHTCTR